MATGNGVSAGIIVRAFGGRRWRQVPTAHNIDFNEAFQFLARAPRECIGSSPPQIIMTPLRWRRHAANVGRLAPITSCQNTCIIYLASAYHASLGRRNNIMLRPNEACFSRARRRGEIPHLSANYRPRS